MTSMRSSVDQDLSSPEEETASSFHTPKHSSIILGNSSRCVSVIASQDSIDVYHDAFSTLHSSQKLGVLNASNSQTPCKSDQRRRHFSSGAKFAEEKEAFDCDEETGEETCMLPTCHVTKFRHSNHGRNQLSRSCNGSPYHIPRFSFSTNSLKRKLPDKENLAGSQNQARRTLTGGAASYGSPVEVGLNEGGSRTKKRPVSSPDVDCSITDDPLDGKSPTGALQDSAKEHLFESNSSRNCSRWENNCVPCSEFQSLYDLSFHLKFMTETQSIGSQKYQTSNFMRKKKNCLKLIKEEFSTTNFKFTHEAPHLFVTSQWQQQNKMCCLYLAYRLFWGVYFFMWGVWSWVGFAGYSSPTSIKGYYPIFLTNWGIWLLMVDTALQAGNVILHIRKISTEGDARYVMMKTSFKCSWVLSNITSTLHVFITIFFWIIIYPQNKKPVSAISVNTHIIPCVYVFLDSFIAATPRRLFHAYHPMILVTIYGVFTNIYYLAGGTHHEGKSSLYPLLDWSEQSKTLLIGSGIVILLIPFLHIAVICVLYAARVKLWRTWNYTRYNHMKEVVQSVAMEEKV